MEQENRHVSLKTLLVPVFAGGIAGISVDFALFPVDSIKTRLQASTQKKDYAKQARDVSKYKGFISAAAASFPCAATFWFAYESSKAVLTHAAGEEAAASPGVHMIAAATAEST